MKCIKYTKEEFLTLYDMVDVIKHNVNNNTVIFDRITKNLHITPNMIWNDENIIKCLERIIQLIATPENRKEFRKFIFYGSLEEAPLLIERSDNLSLLARWRLKIGR